MSSDFSVVAIIAARNEADVIEHVVADLIDQGIRVYFLDDSSTDGTAAIVGRHLGHGVVGIERLSDTIKDTVPAAFEWERILLRKAQLAAELDADWLIHHDADEFRESPWPHLSLRDAIRRVDALGFNAIDFTSLDFWPVDDRFRAGDDVRKALTFYSVRAPYDCLQIRCWKKTDDPVDLASSGGHDARFQGRSIFPLRFLLRHYPIRGQAHGERKVFEERQRRFLDRERARGWHVQYDEVRPGASFIRDASTLTSYDPDAVRLALTLRHRGVEELEEALGAARSEVATLCRQLDVTAEGLRVRSQELAVRDQELAARGQELAARDRELAVRGQEIKRRDHQLAQTRRELDAHIAEVATLRGEIERRAHDVDELRRGLDVRLVEINDWRQSFEERTRLLDECHRSLSWRWTAPARAAYRILKGW